MIELCQSNIRKLRETGWVKLASGIHDEAGLKNFTLQVATILGKPVRGRSQNLVEEIVPKKSTDAPASSLSKKYGFNAFPFHVDTAHWTIPARYLVLCCANPGGSVTPTLLVNRNSVQLSCDESHKAMSSVFLFKNGRKSFYSSVFSVCNKFVRYDPGCMEPQTPDAFQVLKLFSYERIGHLAHRVDWRVGDVVIADNWHMLHARALVNENPSNRLLFRCLVS
ncbi:MAG: TauD/TfdA family dioxygenase [Magnetococcales bacterium]|nr:TauD/TfdA family dioxygenase [Magnetococcales bacterium]